MQAGHPIKSSTKDLAMRRVSYSKIFSKRLAHSEQLLLFDERKQIFTAFSLLWSLSLTKNKMLVRNKDKWKFEDL